MIHKILNWLIGSTWEERKEKERKVAWREARRKHWYSKITKEYWLENTGFEEPPAILMFSLMMHKQQARYTKRMEPYFDRIAFVAMFADVYQENEDKEDGFERLDDESAPENG